MPPKQAKVGTTFSMLSSWMVTRRVTEAPAEEAPAAVQNAEGEREQTPSQTKAVDHETYWMNHATYTNNDGSDDDFDELDTEEAAAIAELMAQAAAQNVTMQVLVSSKRPREEAEPTEATESEAELV
jgi:hypothetical protein